jgi:arylsulfatase
LSAGRTVFTCPGKVTSTPNGDAPSILNFLYNGKAEVETTQSGGAGIIVTQGGRFGGCGFYLLKGKPVFLWNLVDLS